MKATAETTAYEQTARELVAAEVRAEIARQNLTSNSLPGVIGKSQTYWYSRLQAKVAFSSDDLGALSYALQVPMSRFTPDVIASPTPDDGAPVDINTRRRPTAPPVTARKRVALAPVTPIFGSRNGLEAVQAVSR